jgi:uncharacterized membrane protein
MKASFSDIFAKWRGGYQFIISLAVFLVIWIGLNLMPWVPHWDDEHFFLLNLILSIEASFAMPVLLMAQTKQGIQDRDLIQEQGMEDRALIQKDLAADLATKEEIVSLQLYIKKIEVEKLDAIHTRALDLDTKLDLILNHLDQLEKK